MSRCSNIARQALWSREGLGQLTCLGLWKITYQLDLKPTERVNFGIEFQKRIQCTYQQQALLIQDENCL